jgi:predicted MPP superfamily phosphohydrolase
MAGGRGLKLHRYELRIPGLNPAHDGLRIAHLTDIHVGLLTPRARVRRAVELAHQAAPHLTMLTGDFVCYGPRFVEPMGELLAGLTGEVTCVLGNHDYWTDPKGVTRALERQGYSVLLNQHRTVRVGGVDLSIVGIDDAITRHHDVDRAFARVPAFGTVLALSHAPNLADAAVKRGAQLTLAGHTHGGHVRIPRVTERIAGRLGSRYLAGFYRVGARAPGWLYVNCGVGSSSIPLRAGAPAEVAVITLRAG